MSETDDCKRPWDHAADHTFTADELLAWVREHNPQWLEGKA